ncbi:MAG: hypothetical protein GY711_04245 [bacterium]|nr:hypothetical protein [bacterium]
MSLRVRTPAARAWCGALVLASIVCSASAARSGQIPIGPDAGQDGKAPREASAAQDQEGPKTPEELAAQGAKDRLNLVRVDARLSFSAQTTDAALRALRNERDAGRRTAAILALGAVRAVTQRPQLVLWAREGGPAEREAALMALGEMGDAIANGEAVLVDALGLADERLASAALIGLYRTGFERGRKLVRGVADTADHPLRGVAEALFAFEEDRLLAPPPFSIVRLYELRREAAKWYGTIDGLTWTMRLIERLESDNTFLDHIVFLSAAELDLPGIRDHLLEVLIGGKRPVRIRAAVRAMPEVVEQLVANDLWLPATRGEWRVLLESSIDEGYAREMPVTLERASRIEDLAPVALGILAANEPTYDEALLTALESRNPRHREHAAFGIGEGRVKRLLPGLRKLEEDNALRVRATALAARLAMGDGEAKEGLRNFLVEERGDYTRQDRLVVIEILHAASRATPVLDLVAELGKELEGLEQAGLIATVHLRKRTVDLSPLRDTLDGIDLDTPLARRMVRALGYLPSQEDLAWLARRFPIENGAEGNIELGLALARAGHAKLEPVLQHAVWTGSWNRSVLAAAVVKQRSGIRILEHWVTKPPTDVTSEDIRRVGFAIGEWGGLEAVDNLTRRLGGIAGADRPALQGAVLGALSVRTH